MHEIKKYCLCLLQIFAFFRFYFSISYLGTVPSSLKSCWSVFVLSLLGCLPFFTKDIYYDSEFSRIHLPFCFSGNRKHLTLGYVSMSKELFFKLHFLIVSLKFCWFEIHRRNFRSIKDLFHLKIKAIIKVIRTIFKK